MIAYGGSEGSLLRHGEARLAQVVEPQLQGPDVVARLFQERRRRQDPAARAAVEIEDLFLGDLLPDLLGELVALRLRLDPAQRKEDRAFEVAPVPFALFADVDQHRLFLREGG